MRVATVAVMGSCGTRDNFNSRFNPTYKRYYECPVAANQTSMIALMSPPVDEPWEPTREMSDYDRWNVRSDLTREFLRDVAQARPDYLVLDFFADVHFGVMRLDDGRFVTDNRWKSRHTDLYQRLKDEGRMTRLTVFADTEEYLALWREAYERFDAFVRATLPDTTVIVHRGYNTGMLDLPDRLRPVRLRKHRRGAPLDVRRANELWGRLDDIAVEVSGAEQIDLTGTAWSTYDDHPWGPFFVHYTMDYYHRFQAELHKIHLRHAADPDVAAMAEEIDAARAERAGVVEARQRAIIDDQAVRIARLQERVQALEEREERGLATRVAARLSRRTPR